MKRVAIILLVMGNAWGMTPDNRRRKAPGAPDIPMRYDDPSHRTRSVSAKTGASRGSNRLSGMLDVISNKLLELANIGKWQLEGSLIKPDEVQAMIALQERYEEEKAKLDRAEELISKETTLLNQQGGILTKQEDAGTNAAANVKRMQQEKVQLEAQFKRIREQQEEPDYKESTMLSDTVEQLQKKIAELDRLIRLNAELAESIVSPQIKQIMKKKKELKGKMDKVNTKRFQLTNSIKGLEANIDRNIETFYKQITQERARLEKEWSKLQRASQKRNGHDKRAVMDEMRETLQDLKVQEGKLEKLRAHQLKRSTRALSKKR